MGKLPAFMFYPKDWREDPLLQMCSRTARSVWLDILCLAFYAPVRGVCATGDGIPWSNQQIAAAIGGDIGTNEACIAELVTQGVASCDERGAIYSRRMVRDEQERKQVRERVRKFRDSRKTVTVINSENITHVTHDVTPAVTEQKRLGTGNGNVTKYVSKNKPSIEQIREYCAQRKNSVNPETFLAYYERNGWMVGKVPMRDWRAAVRYWEHNEYSSQQQASQAELLPPSAYRACGKNGCIDGWVVTQNGGVKRCQCFEEYKRNRQAV